MGCAVSKPVTLDVTAAEGAAKSNKSQLEQDSKPSPSNVNEAHVDVDANTDKVAEELPDKRLWQKVSSKETRFSSNNLHVTLTRNPSFESRSPSKRNTADKKSRTPHKGDDAFAPGKRERRVGYGTEGVRDQLKKLAIGTGAAKDQPDFYAVSSSESDVSDDEDSRDQKHFYEGPGEVIAEADPGQEADMISRALERSFVFRGIDKMRLQEVIHSMFLLQLQAGAAVLHQGAMPGKNDCMYLLASGEVDIVIAGGGLQMSSNEDRKVEGNMIRIRKQPGWLFGDVALLFNSQRSATVVAVSDITLWALDRRTFSKFVFRHAHGARALRFVRRLPLLKGLSDNALLDVAARMTEETYEDGQALIRMGEQGTKLFLIRQGQVCVMRPSDQKDGPPITLAVLGRGHFVGERTLVTGKLRSADCVAKGQVKVVVMSKRDFQDLDNPLLTWMIDYDAVATVLKGSDYFKKMPADELEAISDCFERSEYPRGEVILRAGEPSTKIGILRSGELSTTGKPLPESGGFAHFGEYSLRTGEPNPHTVTVASDTAVLITIMRTVLDEIVAKYRPLGDPAHDATAASTAAAALHRCQQLAPLTNEELRKMASRMRSVLYTAGDIIAAAGSHDDQLLYIARGRVLVMQGTPWKAPGSSKVALAGLDGESLEQGTVESQQALLSGNRRSTSVIAQTDNTQAFFLTRKAAEEALGGPLASLLARSASSRDMRRTNGDGPDDRGAFRVEYEDLILGRIVGAGQFGMVRIAQNKHTQDVYALKVMHKAPLTESKQVEHVVNERKILAAVTHPFCVRMLSAFQDTNDLYLLQEWVGGGELFHYLDVEGAFTDSTAQFYTANVLLALQHIHSKGIVYRDLKPENLLVDSDGYVKIADYGFAKIINKERTFTICGTPDYQAPEIIMRKGTSVEADYWALGVLIFEMLVGDPPFKSLSGDPWDTFRRTLSGRFFVPANISSAAADLIYKLLQVDPQKRLGSGPNGAEDIKAHHWFTGIDWKALEERKMRAPLLPRLKNMMDTSNFDELDEADLPPNAPGRTDRYAEQWEQLWTWIDDPPPRKGAS